MKHLKSEFDKLSFREFLTFMLAVVLEVSSIVCIFLSLFIDPRGEIHESVLIYYSITSASAASLLGISMYVTGRLDSMKSQVSDLFNIINEKKHQDIRDSPTS